MIHGILSRALVVGNEDPAEFQTLLNNLQDDLQPDGANEQLRVEKMSVALWRMKRLNAVETATIKQAQMTISAKYASKTDGHKAGLGIDLTMRAIPANSQQFIRYKAHAEAQYYHRAMTMLHSLQDRRADRMAIDVSAKQIDLGS